MNALQNQYEIHFVQRGCKRVFRVTKPEMTELRAWKVALMQVGACFGAMTKATEWRAVQEHAEEWGVCKVRWNKASHTYSFAERSTMLASHLSLTAIE